MVHVAELAGRQEGIVKHRQLRDLGLSKSAIGRWQHDGRLHELYRGVYAVGHRALTETSHLVAALFHAGLGSALSHGTGLQWWGLITRAPAEIHIAVPYRRQPTPGIVFHERRGLDRVFHHRLPVTPVPRTLLDFASTASVNDVRRALAQADFRNRLDLPALKAVMGRGLPGSATLRAAVEAHMPELAHTLSPMEDEFLLLCERHGFPVPHPITGLERSASTPSGRSSASSSSWTRRRRIPRRPAA